MVPCRKTCRRDGSKRPINMKQAANGPGATLRGRALYREVCSMKESEKQRLWWLGPLAILLVSLFIWGHSLVPAVQSSAESGRVVALLAPVLEKIGVEPGLWQTLVRKGAHMTEFALLAVVWMVTLVRCKAVPWPRKAATAAAVCMATAVVDETIQLRVAGRSGQISDVWVDLLGAAIGIALTAAVTGFAAWRKRRREKR